MGLDIGVGDGVGVGVGAGVGADVGVGARAAHILFVLSTSLTNRIVGGLLGEVRWG